MHAYPLVNELSSLGQKQSIPQVVKTCRIPPLSSYPVKYPTKTSFTLRSLENAVNFHSEEKLPCKNTWYQDVRSTHIRNKHLLDLPFKAPKCCTDIYNVVLDRQKLKKIKKYGLTRPVRTITHNLEMEEVKKCESDTEEIRDVRCVIFPECYEVSDSFSSDEEESEYEMCESGSVSECTACSTLGTGYMRSKRHKKVKKNIAGLLRSDENEFCKANIAEEFRKHKLGRDFVLKLDKFSI